MILLGIYSPPQWEEKESLINYYDCRNRTNDYLHQLCDFYVLLLLIN